jgi:hypothetical protein
MNQALPAKYFTAKALVSLMGIRMRNRTSGGVGGR